LADLLQEAAATEAIHIAAATATATAPEAIHTLIPIHTAHLLLIPATHTHTQQDIITAIMVQEITATTALTIVHKIALAVLTVNA
jgi:hypothetical protein